MFNWGILSTAKIAQEQLIPAIMQSELGNVAAIASRDLARAQSVAERFGVPHAFGSYEEMLASDKVDGIYIPLPTSQHIEWSIKAAKAGKHVLCEKPISLNAEKIKELVSVQQETGVLIAEAFMVYYHPQWLKVQSLIAEGAIGTLKHVQGSFTYFNRDSNNMRNKPELGGGALPDIGVYPTIVTRMVTGQEPRSVLAKVERDPEFGTDIYSTMDVSFSNFDMSFYVSTQMALRQNMVFHGDEGFIEVHTPFNAGLYGFDEVTLHNQNHSEVQSFRFGGLNQYALQVDNFVRKSRGEDVRIFDLQNSINNQKLIDAIFKSGESGDREAV
ncbi:Gfo/Idh/MocA family protein [Ahrensia sp. 13_GOM-1096m]|uniref:Gfo/Idh/MocA family protein n=1 Tax=Ahrensia sp. 13_GOM-1096m TaxID=1380380 RepID=UPI00047AD338|nr:Gfo/Idh/MocA family oxidoreductase [Ahrensia sp. 13_GOM-1096m]